MGEWRWRTLRMALRKPRRFRFEDVRELSRYDRDNFDWLLAFGFVADLGGGWYALTDRGKASADLGLYEFTAADARTRVPERPRGKQGRPRKPASAEKPAKEKT